MRTLLVCLLVCAPAGAAEPLLTLDEAIRIATRHHPNLEATRAQLEAARARLAQARAGFLPGLNGSFQYNPQTANFAPTPGFQRAISRPSSTGIDTFTDVGGNQVKATCVPPLGPDGLPDFSVCKQAPPQAPLPTTYALFNFWTAGLGLTWNLFDWGRTYYGYRSAKTLVSAQKLTVDATANQVVLDVKLAFYGVLAAGAAVKVADEAVATQKRHADQARAFYQVGSKTKIDLASAESDVASAELTLARAHGAEEASRAALAAALGEDEWHAYRLEAPPEPPDEPPAPEGQLLHDAVEARPEPHELALRARGFAEAAKSLRGAYLPQLLLQLGPSWAGTDLGSLTTNFSLSVSLTYPLTGMNPFLVHAQVKEADANRLATLAQERGVRNAVRLEAANARAQLVSAREAVVAARKLLQAARERRDLAEGRYQAGVGSIIELSDAQLAFVNAQFQEVNATLDVATARARLDHALGRG
jgi:outer membrane protein